VRPVSADNTEVIDAFNCRDGGTGDGVKGVFTNGPAGQFTLKPHSKRIGFHGPLLAGSGSSAKARSAGIQSIKPKTASRLMAI